jgi:hypothetical protein
MSSEYITDVIDIPELIGFVREQVDGDLPFAPFFPPQEVEDIEYELTQVPALAGQVAKYRSWDAVPPLGTRPGVTIIGGEIPPLGLSLRLNEKDIIRFNKLKAKIADKFDARVADRILDDASNLGHSVQNRITLGHGEVLTLGKVSFTELGDPVSTNELVANFGVPGGHFVTAAIPWSTHATAVPVTNLLAWEKTYRTDNNGQNPSGWLISSEAMGDLVLNDQIKAFAYGSGAGTQLVNEDTVTAVIRAAGVRAPLIVSDVERPALDGSGTARVLGARKVCAVKPDMGTTLYGVTANAANLVGNGTIEWTDAPGVIAFVEKSIRPASIITTAEAVAVPVLRDPQAVFCATV